MRACAALAALLAAGCGDDAATSGPDMAVVVDMVPPSDMVTLKPECDVFANTGCPAGQRCTIGTQNGTPRDLCVPVSATPIAEGAACASVDEGNGRAGDNCAAGLICLDFPGDGPHCKKPCFVRAQCASGEACVLTTPTGTQRTDKDAGVEVLHACAHDDGCDPVAQNVCTGGRHCWLSPPDDVSRVGICLMNLKPGMSGASCTAQAECAPGFRCDGLLFCRRYCYFDAPDGGVAAGAGGCPSGEGLCDRFSFSGPVYGICGAD
ncbi:MAG: Amidohydrolase family protein [bacterium]|nr:Amidohydrolase family protein [bacterium]